MASCQRPSGQHNTPDVGVGLGVGVGDGAAGAGAEGVTGGAAASGCSRLAGAAGSQQGVEEEGVKVSEVQEMEVPAFTLADLPCEVCHPSAW